MQLATARRRRGDRAGAAAAGQRALRLGAAAGDLGVGTAYSVGCDASEACLACMACA